MRIQDVIALTVVLAISAGLVFCSPLDDSDVDRIVGGSPASRGQFAHQISLRRRVVEWDAPTNANVTSYKHTCGGSILSDRWIVTAAHCTRAPISTENTIVVVGAHHFQEDGIRYPLERIVSHPKYIEVLTRNDISLLRTKRIIQFHARVQSIPISRRFVDGGLAAIISGWGQDESGDVTEYLKYARVFTLNNDECIQRHEELQAARIFETTLCAFKATGLGACYGDSGGPLVANHTLIGLVSWGVPCGRGKPDMYTRVSSYIDWIVEHTGVHVVD